MEMSGLARMVLQTELDNMRLNLAGCAEGLDPIHLHDLRVAERRTRAALTEFKELFPVHPAQAFREHFKWLHQITNPVRDLDVAISHFPKYRRMVSPLRWGDLRHVLLLLQAQRQDAQEQLAEVIASGRVEDILLAWSQELGEGFVMDAPLSHLSAVDYGGRRICNRYRSIREKACAVTSQSPSADFHALRIRVKKLRYQIEFYSQALGQRRAARLLTRLKKFQDILGGQQDAVVQVEYIRLLAQDLSRRGCGPGIQAALDDLTASYQKQIGVSRKASFQQVRWLIGPGASRMFQRCFICLPTLRENGGH